MNGSFEWLAGRLSAEARIATALAPLALFSGYFLVAWMVFVARGRIGVYRDADIARRGASVVLPMGARHFFAWAVRPLWEGAHRAGISANFVTTLSGILGLAAGLALAGGRFALGGWLYLFAGLCDFVDGRVARASGREGPRGAAIDSVVDRYGDAAVCVGLVWYYRHSWVLLAVVAALVGSMLVSYVRARGEGLGISVKVGLMQRAERVVILGLSLALSPILEALRAPQDPRPPHWLAVAGIIVLALGSHATALQRFVHLLRNLPALPPRRRTSPSYADGRSVRVRFGLKRWANHEARRAEK